MPFLHQQNTCSSIASAQGCLLCLVELLTVRITHMKSFTKVIKLPSVNPSQNGRPNKNLDGEVSTYFEVLRVILVLTVRALNVGLRQHFRNSSQGLRAILQIAFLNLTVKTTQTERINMCKGLLSSLSPFLDLNNCYKYEDSSSSELSFVWPMENVISYWGPIYFYWVGRNPPYLS